MHLLRHKSLIACATTVALIICAALYASHALADPAHEHEHCDLCVHLGGAASAPAAAKVSGKPPLVARVPAVPVTAPRAVRSPLGAHLPRGPPLKLTLA